jgi:hypothetical protein
MHCRLFNNRMYCASESDNSLFQRKYKFIQDWMGDDTLEIEHLVSRTGDDKSPVSALFGVLTRTSFVGKK